MVSGTFGTDARRSRPAHKKTGKSDFLNIEILREGPGGKRERIGSKRLDTSGPMSVFEAMGSLGDVQYENFGTLGKLVYSVGGFTADKRKKEFMEFEVDGNLIEGKNADVEKVFVKEGANISIIIRTPEVYSNEDRENPIFYHYDKHTGKTRTIEREEVPEIGGCTSFLEDLDGKDFMGDLYEMFMGDERVETYEYIDNPNVIVLHEKQDSGLEYGTQLDVQESSVESQITGDGFIPELVYGMDEQMRKAQRELSESLLRNMRRLEEEGEKTVTNETKMDDLFERHYTKEKERESTERSSAVQEMRDFQAEKWLIESGILKAEELSVSSSKNKSIKDMIAEEKIKKDYDPYSSNFFMFATDGRKDELEKTGKKMDPLEAARLKDLQEQVTKMSAEADERLRNATSELEKLQARNLSVAKMGPLAS